MVNALQYAQPQSFFSHFIIEKIMSQNSFQYIKSEIIIRFRINWLFVSLTSLYRLTIICDIIMTQKLLKKQTKDQTPMIEDEKNWSETLISRVSSSSALPRYQLLLFTNFGIKWILAGMILFCLNFFYITPQFECHEGEVPVGKTCQQYVCNLNQQQWSLHLAHPIPKSIALDYGVIMLCSKKWLSSLLQSMSYLGSFVGYFIMPFIADNFGRRLAQHASWIINIIGLIILVSSFNLEMVGIGSFMMGLGANSAITLHYTFLRSLLVGKMRQRSFLILQIMFSIGVGLVALASMFIPNWKIVAGVFIIVPSILILPYSVWIIQQTPNFSLKKGKGTLLKSLNKIARLNSQQELVMEDIQFVPERSAIQKSSKAQYSLLDLFRYKSLRSITIITGLLNMFIQFIYDGTILSLDKIGVNVYLDQILVGFVEIFAALFCSWIVVKVRRKQFLIIFYLLAAFFTIVIGILTLFFSHKNNEINAHVIFQMIILGCLRFVLNNLWGVFFVYVAQLFPSNILSLVFGWVSVVGTTGAFIAPYIRLLTANATMFLMAILCIVSVFLMREMRQTKNQKMIQQIQQRMQQKAENKASVVSQKEV